MTASMEMVFSFARPKSLPSHRGDSGLLGAAAQQRRRIMSTKQSLGQRWEAFRPSKSLTFWSCAACVAGTILLGFTWGGWTTGGTTQATAQKAALDARNELAAVLCVDRFKAAGDASAQLVALQALQGWSRGQFVDKGGWAAMPDKVEPGKGAARLCADKLAVLETPVASATVVQ
jgi:hypothetical protein